MAAALVAPLLFSTFFCIAPPMQPRVELQAQVAAAVVTAPPSQAPVLPAFVDILARAAALSPIKNLVYLCLVNNGFRHFALNLHLAAQMTTPPMRNLVFYALDANVSTYLKHHDVPFVFFDLTPVTVNLSAEASKFRSRDYAKIVGSKAKVAHEVLVLGYDAFILDADIALMRNPSNYIVDIPKCDLTVSVDKATHDLAVPGEGRYSGHNFEAGLVALKINTGVILWRSTPAAINTLATFLKDKYRTRYPRIGDDQYEFNKFMATRSKDNSIDRGFLARHSTCSLYRGVSTYVLSPVFFAVSAGARSPLANALANMFAVVPYVVHFTDSGDAAGKLGTMRNHSVWLVADERDF